MQIELYWRRSSTGRARACTRYAMHNECARVEKEREENEKEEKEEEEVEVEKQGRERKVYAGR